MWLLTKVPDSNSALAIDPPVSPEAPMSATFMLAYLGAKQIGLFLQAQLQTKAMRSMYCKVSRPKLVHHDIYPSYRQTRSRQLMTKPYPAHL